MDHTKPSQIPDTQAGVRTLTDQQFVDLVRYVIRNDLIGTPSEFIAKQESIAGAHEIAAPDVTRFVQNSHAVVLKGAAYTEDDVKSAEAIWQYGLGRDDFEQKLVSRADEINRQMDIRPDLLKYELRMHGGPGGVRSGNGSPRGQV